MKTIKWNGYSFNEDGTILNKDGSIKTPSYNRKGYQKSNFYVNGRGETHLIHKLFAFLYLGEKPKGMEIDHINNNRADNRPCNLRYVTKSENNKKSYDSGNRIVDGFKNANSRYTEEQFEKAIRCLNEGMSYGKVMRHSGIRNINTVYKLKKGIHFYCKVQRLSKEQGNCNRVE